MTPAEIPDTIWMVTEADDETDDNSGARSSEDTGGDFGTLNKSPRGKSLVKVETLCQEMGTLIRVVRHVFSEAEQQVGMELAEVTLSVEVSGEGSVSILGSGGKAAAKGAINLKFTRVKP